MYRRDSGEILIQRASFSFFFQAKLKCLDYSEPALLHTEDDQFHSSTENIQESAIPHTQGLISCPVLWAGSNLSQGVCLCYPNWLQGQLSKSSFK